MEFAWFVGKRYMANFEIAEKEIVLSYKNYFSQIFKLMIPIALQNLLLTSLNLIDTVMVGQLGDVAIAGCGIANQIYFLLNLFVFGVTSATAIFTSQFWGASDIENIKKTTATGIKIVATFVFFFETISFLFPSFLIGLFTKDNRVISTGSIYLKVVSFSFLPMSISFIFSYILRTMHFVKISLLASFIGIGLNTILNYFFIFGFLFIPAMGVKGAAIATIIARIVELSTLLFFIYLKNLPCAIRLKHFFINEKGFFAKFIKITLPVILNEMLWSLGVTIYTVIYARISTPAVAASNIALTIERFAFVFFIGLANASAVLIGNYIGKKEYKIAEDLAKKGLLFSLFLGVVIGLLVYFFTPYILLLFNVSNEVNQIVKGMMLIYCFIVTFRAENVLLIVGIFRSGGDTTFSLIVDTGSVWFCGIPLGFLAAFIFKLPVPLVFLAISSEEFLKIILSLIRFFKRKWIHHLI
jgi:putative MATE family efflux protein